MTERGKGKEKKGKGNDRPKLMFALIVNFPIKDNLVQSRPLIELRHKFLIILVSLYKFNMEEFFSFLFTNIII